jgi:hypothetical protein
MVSGETGKANRHGAGQHSYHSLFTIDQSLYPTNPRGTIRRATTPAW